MRLVNVKELKAKLDSYVGKTFNGKKIIITDHGKEVALIVPISNERPCYKLLIKANKAKMEW